MVLNKYIIKYINILNYINTKYIKNVSSLTYGNDNITTHNIRSIFANLDELVLMLNSNDSNFDIIILSKMWLL